MFCRLCSSTRPRSPAIRAAGLLSMHVLDKGVVEHVCVHVESEEARRVQDTPDVCPVAPPPVSSFQSPPNRVCS